MIEEEEEVGEMIVFTSVHYTQDTCVHTGRTRGGVDRCSRCIWRRGYHLTFY